VVPRQAVAVATGLRARDDVLTGLGLKPVEQRVGDLVIGHGIPADPTGATEVPGVWVAGNVTDVMAQVVGAAAAGLRAGAAINGDLVAEDARLAVDAHLFGEAAWEERYRARAAIWSGRPNAQLVAEASGLTAGAALDVGSGEGADAIWLAEHGWRVTALDISTVAIERARGHAEAAGVADRIEWVHADVTTWVPPEGRFDLVSAHFMHLPEARRRVLHDRLAAAVAPGGTLLVVGHHPLDLRTTMPRSDLPGLLFTAEELAGELDPTAWEVQVSDARPRPATDPEGREVTIHDAVLRARRV
jgi:SAM-dependent methyltransferase